MSSSFKLPDSFKLLPEQSIELAALAQLEPPDYLPQPGGVEGLGATKPQDTVLVVLGDCGEREQLTEALAGQGCQIWLAADAESALQIAVERQPNLMVLGISLPGKDGFQACGELHDEPRTRHIPVILLSHGVKTGEKIRGLQMGAVDYITIPCDWREVAAQVRSQLKLERLRGDLAAMHGDLLAREKYYQAGLTAAAQIQQSLLPQRAAENFDGISVAWKFLPLEQVGGDLLGYAWLDDDYLAAYVVDVCGHGLPAAMMTAAISTSLAPAAGRRHVARGRREARSPRDTLERLDREYPFERFDRPFTIAYLVLNRRTGEFRSSRAGHPMPIIIRGGGRLEMIEAGGTIIGLDRMLPFDEECGRLDPGDSILLYSDGVTECPGGAGSFGLARLDEILGQCAGNPPATICERIMARLLHFNGGGMTHDDVTMLALTYHGEGRSGESIASPLDTHLPYRGN